jgi:hypothetical protein
LDCLFQTDDLGQGRFRAELCGPEGKTARFVDRGAEDCLPFFFQDADTFTGQHGLIDRRTARQDDAVRRDLLTRPDEDDISLHEARNGDIDPRISQTL